MGHKRQQLIVVFFDPSTEKEETAKEVECFWAVYCEGDIIYIYILILVIL